MLVSHDDISGFSEAGIADPTYDIPDAEWAAYRRLVDLANEMEDRFVAQYALEQIDEFADLRGVLSDDEINAIKAVRDGVASESFATPSAPRLERVSPEVAAMRNIEAARRKCPHPKQVGPFNDGSVRCGQCGVVLYRGTGVKRSANTGEDHPEWFHNPGSVSPRQFEGDA